MKFHRDMIVYGDMDYRGECPSETLEQVTFFARLRTNWPDSWGRIAVHIRNEGQRTYMQAARQKAEGMTKGASDVMIPGSPAFVCEIKRRDHTKSRFQDGQEEYLIAAQKLGAFVCIALGADAATEAFNDYLEQTQPEDRKRDARQGRSK
jgi:hypothetical protein